jgi:hypothetical protein
MSNTIPQLKDGAQTVFFKAGGEWCYLRTPSAYKGNGEPIPCVIQCHGNSGYVTDNDYAISTTDTPDEEGKSIFIRTLVDSGMAVAGSHASGSAWGRPDAVSAYATLFEALVKEVNVDQTRMGMLGGGLGGSALWSAVTGPLLGRVRAVGLQQATLSFESVIRDHKFKEDMLGAWGIPEDTEDDVAVASLANNDPLNRTRLLIAERGAAEVAKSLPEVRFFHGDQDENMLYQENPVALSKVLRECGARFSFKTYEGVGHATYAMGEPVARDIASYFKQAFSL